VLSCAVAANTVGGERGEASKLGGKGGESAAPRRRRMRIERTKRAASGSPKEKQGGSGSD